MEKEKFYNQLNIDEKDIILCDKVDGEELNGISRMMLISMEYYEREYEENIFKTDNPSLNIQIDLASQFYDVIKRLKYQKDYSGRFIKYFENYKKRKMFYEMKGIYLKYDLRKDKVIF